MYITDLFYQQRSAKLNFDFNSLRPSDAYMRQ